MFPGPSTHARSVYMFPARLHMPGPSTHSRSVYMFPARLHMPGPSTYSRPVHTCPARLHMPGAATHSRPVYTCPARLRILGPSARLHKSTYTYAYNSHTRIRAHVNIICLLRSWEDVMTIKWTWDWPLRYMYPYALCMNLYEFAACVNQISRLIKEWTNVLSFSHAHFPVCTYDMFTHTYLHLYKHAQNNQHVHGWRSICWTHIHTHKPTNTHIRRYMLGPG